MNNMEVYEDASLIKAIINISIFDAFNFKNPKKPLPFKRPKKSKKKDKNLDPDYVSNDAEYLAWDARRFMKKDNILFCHYCELIDIDPESLAEKIGKKIKEFDKSRKKLSKRIDFLNVNTL